MKPEALNSGAGSMATKSPTLKPRAIRSSKRVLPVACHLIFTIAEEVGLGVPGTLQADVAEIVAVDNGTIAPGQNTAEYGVTIALATNGQHYKWHDLVNGLMMEMADYYR